MLSCSSCMTAFLNHSLLIKMITEVIGMSLLIFFLSKIIVISFSNIFLYITVGQHFSSYIGIAHSQMLPLTSVNICKLICGNVCYSHQGALKYQCVWIWKLIICEIIKQYWLHIYDMEDPIYTQTEHQCLYLSSELNSQNFISGKK